MAEPRGSFEELLERSRAEYEAWTHPEIPRIDLAWDTSSLAAGCEATREALLRLIEERGAAVEVGRTVGYGLQWLQPLAHITWPDGTTVLYGPVTPQSVGLLVDEATGRVGAAAELAIGVLSGERPGIPAIERHPFLANEQGRRLLANVGRIDPERISHYIARDGYFAANRMLERHQEPAAVRQLVTDAGLTGRGGAFFPTGVKWGFLAGSQQPRRFLVCNADEGDPGAWVNRILMEGDPHLVIEGMLIAGYGSGAQHGFIYIRNEYPLAIERMRLAIAQAEEAGLLGRACWDGVLLHARGDPGRRRLRLRRGDRAHRLGPGRARHAAHQAAVPGGLRRLLRTDQRQQRRELRERAADPPERCGVVPRARHGGDPRHEDLLLLGGRPVRGLLGAPLGRAAPRCSGRLRRHLGGRAPQGAPSRGAARRLPLGRDRGEPHARARLLPTARRPGGGGGDRLRLRARLLHRPERDVRGIPGGRVVRSLHDLPRRQPADGRGLPAHRAGGRPARR